MRRRDFIQFIASSAAAWPFVAQAQQTAMPVIGFLRSTSEADSTNFVTSFRQGLEETGFVEGKNVAIEYRYADNQLDRLSVLMADLVRLPAAVIVVNAPAAHVAKDATTTVPIVFVTGADPVKDGLVASLNRPSSNVTGVTFLRPVRGEAIGVAAPARAQGDNNWRTGEPGQSRNRDRAKRFAGCGAGYRAATHHS